jgi:hypothetical protein
VIMARKSEIDSDKTNRPIYKGAQSADRCQMHALNGWLELRLRGGDVQ